MASRGEAAGVRYRRAGCATDREVVVVAAVLVAGSEKAAAHRLGLSHSTVKHRLANARTKVGAETTAQLVWILAPQLPEPEGTALWTSSPETAVAILWSPLVGWALADTSPRRWAALSTFVIVPGAWDTPATMEPLVEPLESAGHKVIIVDLPCDDAAATLEQYADAVRAVLPDDLADVVLVGYSFGGFTATRIAVEHPELPVVYVAAWIPRSGASVLDLFIGSDPFADADEDAGMAAFGGLVVSAGPGRCALNIDQYVAAADPAERDAVRAYLERTQRPQGIAVLRQKWHGDLPTSVRRTYILTTADTLVPPDLQRVMAASVDAEIVEIATGHGPFREQPQRLAELLVAATC